MAHGAQQEYCKYVRQKFPKNFDGEITEFEIPQSLGNWFSPISVLDVGSQDINGNNRYLFKNYKYTGIDVGPGNNVDIVTPGHLFRSENLFDFIISTECFEHDKFWDLTIYNTWFHLKPGGMYLFTCAADGRPEHGTARSDGHASPHTQEYYMNLNEQLVRDRLPLQKMFSEFEFITNKNPNDLYFYGFKR